MTFKLRNETVALGSLLLMLSICLGSSWLIPQNSKPEHLFQRALRAEMVEGDLQSAIRLYQDIVENFGADRTTTAKALYSMASCYEKLGEKKAGEIYMKLVEEYPKESDYAARARERLRQMEVSGGPAGRAGFSPVSSKFLLDEMANIRPRLPYTNQKTFDFSPDGKQVVFESMFLFDGGRRRGLSIADGNGSSSRPFASDFKKYARASIPRWSPDGRSIAYTVPAEKALEWTIMLYDVKTAVHRPVATLEGQVRDLAWAPDGREIFFVRRGIFGTPASQQASIEGLHALNFDGNVRRIQPMEIDTPWSFGGLSPDGKWVAFSDRHPEDDQLEVWLIPSSGGQVRQITWHPGIDAHPTWGSGGSEIYFVSDRNGDANLFRLEIDPATGVPKGEARQLTSFEDSQVLMPHLIKETGEVAYVLLKMISMVHLQQSGTTNESRELVRGERPLLSPDGQTVYYLAQGPEQEGIHSIPAKGGSSRKLTGPVEVPTFYGLGFDLSPDGTKLAFVESGEDHLTIQVIPAAGGNSKKVVDLEHDVEADAVNPQWSPDGETLLYARKGSMFVVPADGSAAPRRIAEIYRWNASTARWSPDGSRISALGYENPAQPIAAWVVPAEGGSPIRLTSEAGYKEILEWHPDGKRLTYLRYVPPSPDRKSETEIRMVTVDGEKNEVFIDVEGYWDYVGIWESTGRIFYYAASSQRGWEMLAWNTETGTRELFFAGDAEGLPSITRDGSLLAFAVANQTQQLWVSKLGRP